MRPQAIPLAILSMEKETLGFHNFYAWFSSVSPISIGVGLRTGEALRKDVCFGEHNLKKWHNLEKKKKKSTILA